MKELVDKLKSLEKNISKEKGPFVLFALFLREDAPNEWDLIVSSPWLNENKNKSLKYVAEKLNKFLTRKELMALSRIVIVDQDDPALDAVLKTARVENGVVEVRDSTFYGLYIKHAFIISSQKSSESKAVAS